jgi:phospholipase A1
MRARVSLALVLAAALALALALPSAPALAQSPDCTRIDAPTERLACYDRQAGRKPQPEASVLMAAQPAPPKDPSARSSLGERWAIDQRDSIFDIRPHEPMYILLGRVSDNVNQRPGTPTRPPGPVDLGVEDVEAKFQISFKFRLAQFDNPWLPSLWGAYTQQSNWQVYNSERSAYFRNTDHSPELMLAWHPDLQAGPFKWRLFNVGFLHQSNGRSEVLSRSWNRVYAQFGLEAGNFQLLVRPWARLSEDAGEDDNPDITDYLGYGDLVASYQWGSTTLSLKGRPTGKGYAEASVSFPLARRMRGYVQATTGYGESLIDYNWRQSTIGVGVSLFDWQ